MDPQWAREKTQLLMDDAERLSDAYLERLAGDGGVLQFGRRRPRYFP
jgi:hypothetical protein